MGNTFNPGDPAAIRLAVAVTRLRARLREVAGPDSTGLSMSQIAVLKRLRDGGPDTASSLAQAEHVTQQGMAQILAGLRADGLVHAEADPTDGRKTLNRITDAGVRLFESALAARHAWLDQAIAAEIGDDELPALDRAIELLERLAATGRPSSRRTP